MKIEMKIHRDSETSGKPWGMVLTMENNNGMVKVSIRDRNGNERSVEVDQTEFFPAARALETEAK